MENPADLELPSLLVFARPSDEMDDMLASLLLRDDLCVLRVATTRAARLTLRHVAVTMVIICPQTRADAVVELLAEVDRKRPGIPVLAVRGRDSEGVPKANRAPWASYAARFRQMCSAEPSTSFSVSELKRRPAPVLFSVAAPTGS